MAATLAELARRFGAEVRGDAGVAVTGVASLERAGPADLAFLADKKHRPLLAQTRAAAVLLGQGDVDAYDGNRLVVANPSLVFARIAAWLHPPAQPVPGKHPTAVVDPGATLAASASVAAYAIVETGAVIEDHAVIGPGCVVGCDVRIGAGTQLVANVYVGDRCELGRNCLVQPGAVIGADGFGFVREGERWIKVPQLGRVVIGDDVEIGANTTIDRATLNDTVIGDGVKLDNLIQIGHNVRVGDHTIMAACVGIAGSATIGKRCALGGQVGVAGHLKIPDDVQVLGTSLVAGDIDAPGTYSSAIRAMPADEWRRNAARLKQLDQLAQRIRALEQQIKQTKGNDD